MITGHVIMALGCCRLSCIIDVSIFIHPGKVVIALFFPLISPKPLLLAEDTSIPRSEGFAQAVGISNVCARNIRGAAFLEGCCSGPSGQLNMPFALFS